MRLCFAGQFLTTRQEDELDWNEVEESRLTDFPQRMCKVMCCCYEMEICGEVLAPCMQAGCNSNTVQG